MLGTGSRTEQHAFVPPAVDVAAEVRRIFAEVTRYPIEILEPAADVEDELGIDSVKLGEILAALRERFALPPTSELRTRFPASQLRTIGGITEAIAKFARASASAVDAIASVTAAPLASPFEREVAVPSVPSMDSASGAPASLIDDVRQVFADLTRYPVEILTPDADLEDELGIDSVKLGEIFSVLRERYALPPRTELRDRITPGQLRTIGGVTEIVRSFGEIPTPMRDVTTASEAASQLAAASVAPVRSTASVPRIEFDLVSASEHVSIPSDGSKGSKWDGAVAGELEANLVAAVELLRVPCITDVRLIEVERGRAVLEALVARLEDDRIGVGHGLAATLLQAAMSCAVSSALPDGGRYTTTELNVHVPGPIAIGGKLRSEGETIYVGRSIATVHGRLLDDVGTLVAHATANCVIG